MKNAFACHNAGDREDLKEYLKNEHNIYSESYFSFKDKYVISVPDEDYLAAIKYGRIFLENTELDSPTFYYDICNNLIPLNFIPYLEINLPKENISLKKTKKK